MSERYRQALQRSSFGAPEVTQARKTVSTEQKNTVLKKLAEKRASTSKKGRN